MQCQRSAVAVLENSKSKKYLIVTSPTGMGSPFDSEQLL